METTKEIRNEDSMADLIKHPFKFVQKWRFRDKKDTVPPSIESNVTLWTVDFNYCRQVSSCLISQIKGKVEILPDSTIHTKCATIGVLDQLILYLRKQPLTGGFRTTIALLDVAQYYDMTKLSKMCMKRLNYWKNSYETHFDSNHFIERTGYKLINWFTKVYVDCSPINELQAGLRFSGRNSFDNFMDFENLRKLLELGDAADYSTLSSKAHLEIQRCAEIGLELTSGGCEFSEEVLQREGDFQSGQLTLISLDGFRVKVDKRVLIKESDCFRGIFAVLDNCTEIICVYCRDKYVLICWVDYMLNKNFKLSFQFLRSLEKERVLIELLRVADYYIIDGLLLYALKLLNLTVKDRNAFPIYNNLPINYMSNDDWELGKYLKRKIEKDFALEIYDSPKFLNIDPIELVLIVSNLEDFDTQYTLLETYTHCNSESLKESIDLPHEGLLAERLCDFKIFTIQEEILKINLNDFNFKRVQKCLAVLYRRTGRQYPVLDVLVKEFINSDLEDISKINENPNAIVILRTERSRDEHLDGSLVFQIYKEERKFDQCSITVGGLGGFLRGIRSCVLGRKIILWNFICGRFVYQGVVIDMDTKKEILLADLGDIHNIIYWSGKFLAIDITYDGVTWIYNAIDNEWRVLDFGDVLPLVGRPLVIGDRLYILPYEDDWIRFIRPYEKEDEEDDYDCEFVQDFVVPPSVDEEPLDSPHRFFRLDEESILATLVVGDRIYLARTSDILIYEKDNLRFVENRALPPIPEDNGWFEIITAISVSGNLLFLGRDDDFLEVHLLDCENWKFTRILRDEYSNHGHLEHDGFGFVEYNQLGLPHNFKDTYIQLP